MYMQATNTGVGEESWILYTSSGENVSVNDETAHFGQHVAHRSLSTGYSTRQPEHQHPWY